jgi:hypothetical protein
MVHSYKIKELAELLILLHNYKKRESLASAAIQILAISKLSVQIILSNSLYEYMLLNMEMQRAVNPT